MTKKKRYDRMKKIVEVIIRLLFFVIYPAVFSAAFTGIKMSVKQMAEGEPLEWNSFTATLVIVLLFTFCFGRTFCGFFCAFGSYGDFVYFLSSLLRKKLKKRPFHLPDKWGGILRYGKYMVMMAVLLLCIRGMDSMTALHSPVTAFSRLHGLQKPDSIIGLGLFVLLTMGMAVEPRFFCRFFCPMGAVFSLMPVLPVSVIKRDRDNCITGCRACRMSCPAGLEIPSLAEGENHLSGECFACGKCAARCPRQNVKLPGGQNMWLPLLVIKAGALAGLLLII